METLSVVAARKPRLLRKDFDEEIARLEKSESIPRGGLFALFKERRITVEEFNGAKVTGRLRLYSGGSMLLSDAVLSQGETELQLPYIVVDRGAIRHLYEAR